MPRGWPPCWLIGSFHSVWWREEKREERRGRGREDRRERREEGKRERARKRKKRIERKKKQNNTKNTKHTPPTQHTTPHTTHNTTTTKHQHNTQPLTHKHTKHTKHTTHNTQQTTTHNNTQTTNNNKQNNKQTTTNNNKQTTNKQLQFFDDAWCGTNNTPDNRPWSWECLREEKSECSDMCSPVKPTVILRVSSSREKWMLGYVLVRQPNVILWRKSECLDMCTSNMMPFFFNNCNTVTPVTSVILMRIYCFRFKKKSVMSVIWYRPIVFRFYFLLVTVIISAGMVFLTMELLENTPAVLSLGKLCDENGYSYDWINGQKPHLIKNGIRIICKHRELRSFCGSRLVKFIFWIFINFKDTYETGESFFIIFFILTFFTYSRRNFRFENGKMRLTVTSLQCQCLIRLMIDQGNLMMKPKPTKSQKQKENPERTG